MNRNRGKSAPATSRRGRRVVIAVLLVFIVLVVVVVSAFAYTRRAGFCSTGCHEMRPFAASLRSSVHRDVQCAACHQDPGVRNALAAEWKGIASLVRHVGGAKTVEIQGIDPTKVPSRRCLACHPWHKLQRPVKLATVEFDHLSHAQVDCVTCHLRTAHPGVPGTVVDPPATMLACFDCHHGREGSGNCLFCHAPTHRGRGPCQKCHGLTGWLSGLFFRHDPALGKHSTAITCEACHNKGYGRHAARRACAGCHRPAHGGLADCAACHRLRAWLPTTFRHPAVAGHVVAGRATMACDSCHPGGAFGRASCSCHTPPYGHASLTGGHRWLVCSSCHAGGRGGAARCATCHQAPHRRPTDCARCHALTSWRPARFVHPAAGPHLSGGRRLACSACHTSGYGNATCGCHGSTPPGVVASH